MVIDIMVVTTGVMAVVVVETPPVIGQGCHHSIRGTYDYDARLAKVLYHRDPFLCRIPHAMGQWFP